MRSTLGAARTLVTGVAAFALTASFSTRVQADPINYGDFEGTTVWYRKVTEDANSVGDEPPLFGEPTVSGDTLDFDPVGFSASAAGAGGNDVTDGNLIFDVEAKPGTAIPTLRIHEAGDTTLAGFGSNATFTSVVTHLFVEIYEVDGVGIDNINLQGDINFSPSGGDFGLGTDGSGGPTFSTSWYGQITFSLGQALTDAGISYERGATKVSVNLDNVLVALSEDGTTSVIAKKDFEGLKIEIPEPTTVAMALCGLIGLALAHRRRS